MQQSLKDSYTRWLEGMRWEWWTTPTFKNPHSHPLAVAAVHQWLASLAPEAYAVVAYESGAVGGRLHVHAMVGGVGRSPLVGTLLARAWRRGVITVEPFDPTKRGIRYMLDVVDDAEYLDIIGGLRVFHPRRRRSR